MSLYQEFQAAIQAGNLKEALLIAFSNNLELKITTSLVSPTKNQSYSWRSQLNLLNGLEIEVSKELLNDNYQNLHQLHTQQIDRAYQTWENNQATLIKVLQLLAGITVQQNGDKQEEKAFSTEAISPLEVPQTEESALNNNSPEELIEARAFNLPLEIENIDPEVSVEENAINLVDDILGEDSSNLVDDILEEKAKIETKLQSPASEEPEDDEDWGEWLEETDLSPHNSNPNLDDLDWSDEENWEDITTDCAPKNVSQDK